MSDLWVDLPATDVPVRPALPRLGGRNPQGDTIGVTTASLTWNGAPWLPVAGEIHFARLPRERWKDSLLAMKAGGVDIASLYVFWIHHEEEQGVFDWSGNRDLRGFIAACAETGMLAIVRIGPFCHGEVRNGGLPDWLYGRPFRVRSNDEPYLGFVRRLYGEIGRQLAGLYFKDAGPVIGIQLENELFHAGAPWETTPRLCMEYVPAGFDGVDHLRRLKAMALEAGMVVPLYTVTGWGGAAILPGETLPLYGGYAYCPWNVTPNRPEHAPTGEYVFRDFHASGVSYGIFDPPYDPSALPFACCELGGGMQSWYGYRFAVEPQSAEAMALVKIAGGCSLLGYYMYHGGSNPVGRHAFLNEHVTPRISYDFQAPVGEFGQVRESARRLRRLHLFLQSFGRRMVAMRTLLPEGAAAIAATDTETLRYAARAGGEEGFLFLCNYQDHVAMKDHHDVAFRLPLSDGELRLPRTGGLTVRREDSAILPFNLAIADLRLIGATTQPLARIDVDGTLHYFFFAHDGMRAEYCWDRNTLAEAPGGDAESTFEGSRLWLWPTTGLGSPMTLRSASGRRIAVHTLSEAESLGCHRLTAWGRERLVIADCDLHEDAGRIVLTHRGAEARSLSMEVFPRMTARLAIDSGALSIDQKPQSTRVRVDLPGRATPIAVSHTAAGPVEVRVPRSSFEGVHELLLCVDYDGDMGNAFIDGALVADNFANGREWEIGLSGLQSRLNDAPLCLRITPRREGSVVVSESAMAMKTELVGKEIAEVRSVRAEPVREVRIAAAD
jgi:hypothetical protein